MKRAAWFIIILILSVLALFIGAAQADNSGTCGDNLTWTLDDEGTLIITGTGEMSSSPSWPHLNVKKVIIQEGATSISYNAFNSCSNLTSITMPGVTSLAPDAFDGCPNVIVEKAGE